MELLQFNITVVMKWNNQITGVEVYLMAQPKVQFEGWILQPSIPWYIFDKLGTYSRFGAILISTLAMHCVSSWDTETINYNRYISPCCELIVHNFFFYFDGSNQSRSKRPLPLHHMRSINLSIEFQSNCSTTHFKLIKIALLFSSWLSTGSNLFRSNRFIALFESIGLVMCYPSISSRAKVEEIQSKEETKKPIFFSFKHNFFFQKMFFLFTLLSRTKPTSVHSNNVDIPIIRRKVGMWRTLLH